uniref:peptidylprolyl isomerase n=1 Tax=Pseudo-nitzschia australis TaxID=44445 RepID=A0A7S4ACN8_9STRA|mmetsp:Transcript_18263/g.39808  ORF Transcript_18263/g.39808 Transcript_18263/m.39808 type:complete len:151 (-) Transcript_18263:364-816(-)|eukprot:CAMPEP_0168183262 /NCGR_PEP_ID=MMETSP0139_2-20121125/12424_1 /TAXON_ID=44445 /ORGANISM="Pseudo-nitzschia australis, Strain 10249 10 AB" /LENGTH=150 /DNA_ID=CAMNT_0008104429 /DNA_START=188 /DNA_END=640 /DNA_ORIENTATION=+
MFSFRSVVLLLALVIAVSAGTNKEGLAFLAKKAAEEGVVKLDSGLMYKEITAGGNSGKKAKINTPCECHYAGTLINGVEFDSSYKRGQPLTFAPNQVIKGWTEALQLMDEGAKWELYIPSELGYGDRGAGGSIPGGAVLIFTLELITIKS